MPSATRYGRGDIVPVSFPFTDISSSKSRPALVVSHSTLVLRNASTAPNSRRRSIARLTLARQNGAAAASGMEK